MFPLLYYYSKFVKKVLRGKCIVGSRIDKTAKINSGCSVYNSRIGCYSYMGYDCEIINSEIGSFCSLASGIHIGLAEHPTEWISTSPVFQNVSNSSVRRKFASLAIPKGKITVISHDVWIGTNAIIKQGVNVGVGAVIASGAVVTKDVPPYAIVGGCPAKVIRYRFDKETIQQLLQSEWWNYSEEKLMKIGIYANDPVKFVEMGGVICELRVGSFKLRVGHACYRSLTSEERRMAA